MPLKKRQILSVAIVVAAAAVLLLVNFDNTSRRIQTEPSSSPTIDDETAPITSAPETAKATPATGESTDPAQDQSISKARLERAGAVTQAGVKLETRNIAQVAVPGSNITTPGNTDDSN